MAPKVQMQQEREQVQWVREPEPRVAVAAVVRVLPTSSPQSEAAEVMVELVELASVALSPADC